MKAVFDIRIKNNNNMKGNRWIVIEFYANSQGFVCNLDKNIQMLK